MKPGVDTAVMGKSQLICDVVNLLNDLIRTHVLGGEFEAEFNSSEQVF